VPAGEPEQLRRKPFRALLKAWALTSRLRTAMPFNWPNKVSSSACTLAHIPDIIIAAMRGKVRWRSRVKAPGRRRTWSTRAGSRRNLENSSSSDWGSSV
jgi:hypothetical protein